MSIGLLSVFVFFVEIIIPQGTNTLFIYFLSTDYFFTPTTTMDYTVENEKKKAYLKEYRGHVRRIRRIEAELEELRTMRTSISINNDGMPRGSGQSDLSGYAAELDKLEQDLVHERYERVMTYKDIASRIKALNSENEKDVLFYRYIKGLEWWEIAEKMGYSERHITRLHGKALAHLDIPKDVLECPVTQ